MSYYSFGNNMSVYNLGGTSGPYYTSSMSGSWISAFRDIAGVSDPDCAVLGCGSAGSHGAHVRFADTRTNGGWAITSMCAKHNNPNNRDTMRTKRNARFVDVRDI